MWKLLLLLIGTEIIAAVAAQSVCDWSRKHDGHGDSEDEEGTFPTDTECAQHCEEKKKTKPEINGASVRRSDKMCWCEIGMNKKEASDIYDTCYLKADVDCVSTNPCQNGASCTIGDGGYTCSCEGLHTGKNCEIYVDCASSNPCQNGASCTIGDGGYTCWCEGRLETGKNCEKEISIKTSTLAPKQGWGRPNGLAGDVTLSGHQWAIIRPLNKQYKLLAVFKILDNAQRKGNIFQLTSQTPGNDQQAVYDLQLDYDASTGVLVLKQQINEDIFEEKVPNVAMQTWHTIEIVQMKGDEGYQYYFILNGNIVFQRTFSTADEYTSLWLRNREGNRLVGIVKLAEYYDVRALRCNGVDNGCCTKESPCLEWDGDCDNDGECAEGLICGKNNCPWGDNDECCVKAGFRCNGIDNGCCTKESPCLEGDGDCDNDGQCAKGLICGPTNNCPWGDNDSCCVKDKTPDVCGEWKVTECTVTCGGGHERKTRECEKGGVIRTEEEVHECNAVECPHPCAPTLGGNSGGSCCTFPFTYRGQAYHKCTDTRWHAFWCATTDNYDIDGKWGECDFDHSCLATEGGNSDPGHPCHFPFIYRGKYVNSCIKTRHNQLWCATTDNYDTDWKWGNCLPETCEQHLHV